MMLTLLLLLCGAARAQGDGAERQIRQLLDRQVADWNRGDVPAFMEGYDKSDVTFVGKTVTRGHAQVLAGYLERYPTREKMGRLTFTILEVKLLGADHASVIGRFHLARTKEAGGDAEGIFNLLFHKTDAGWRIILDHTS